MFRAKTDPLSFLTSLCLSIVIPVCASTCGSKLMQSSLLMNSKLSWIGRAFVIELQLKRHNCGRWESFRGLVDIARMCLLYVSFAGGRTVWAL